MKEKICRVCNVSFPLTKEYFFSNGKTPKGTPKWKPTCKPCGVLERKTRAMKVIEEVFGSPIQCSTCGYSKCFAALEFHHTDPSTKEVGISQLIGSSPSEDTLRNELEKCELLCANCHREVHNK